MNEQLELIIFEIINHAGEARAFAYEALNKAENGDFEGAEESLKLSGESLHQAHKVQTSIIHAEARGEKTELSVLFVHAQDHLMTAMESKSLIEHIIKLHKKIDSK